MSLGYVLLMTLLGTPGNVGLYGTQAACEAAGAKLPGAVKVAPTQTLPKSSTKSYYFCQESQMQGL